MTKRLVIAGTVAALTFALIVQSHAQQPAQGRGGAPAGGATRDRDLLQGDAVNGPVPRMADGHPDRPDLEGGGPDADAQAEGESG